MLFGFLRTSLHFFLTNVLQEKNQAETAAIKSILKAAFKKLDEQKDKEVKQNFWRNLQEQINHNFDATDFKVEKLFENTKKEDGSKS